MLFKLFTKKRSKYKLKIGQLTGDMREKVLFWTRLPGNCPDGASRPSTSPSVRPQTRATAGYIRTTTDDLCTTATSLPVSVGTSTSVP